jgi:peptidyl-dipeptidase A
MKPFKTIFLLLVTVVMISSCSNKKEQMTQELVKFIKQHDSVIQPLSKEVNLASWNAAISGKPEDFQKAEELQMKLVAHFANKESLQKLTDLKVSGMITDTLLKRQMDVLYLQFLMAKADTSKLNAIVRMQMQIEQKYGNFRAEVKGKKLSDNEVGKILRESKDVNAQKEAWMAQKAIGSLVAEDVKKLAKMRNDVAKDLGFKNYHQMSLTLSDQDPQVISALFDELDSLTTVAFAQVKKEIDTYFVKYYGLKSSDELMPWNYQDRFFQQAPKIYDIDLDKYYKDKNLETLTATYFDGMGLPVDDIIRNSDLYEKPGKNQHAFCTDIDNKGDVRVLCNISPNSYWMNTMLHEFGHAVYDKNIDTTLPFVLRDPAHTFTTEAIAMLFGRFSSNPKWLQDMMGLSDEETKKIAENTFKTLRLEQLVFSRWSQVMYRFEKGMYENPDQDLNKLWWDLVEKYQMMKRPEGRNEPDWATKVHIATYPCYYHNYLMGELLASQLYSYIAANVLKANDTKFLSFVGKKEVGTYLDEKVFKPGARYYWNEMIERATGEKLTPKYYAKQFVE